MFRLVMLVLSAALLLTSADAASISLKFNNKTGVAINAISAAPKSGGVALNLIAAPIAAATKPSVTITTEGSDCVFTLTYTLASGKVIIVPDTDICQTDQIIVQ